MSSDKTYLIRGTVSDISKPSFPGIAITSARRVVPGSGRDAALGELTVRGDEAVRLELANGFVLWSRADDLIREHGARRSDATAVPPGRSTPGRARARPSAPAVAAGSASVSARWSSSA